MIYFAGDARRMMPYFRYAFASHLMTFYTSAMPSPGLDERCRTLITHISDAAS